MCRPRAIVLCSVLVAVLIALLLASTAQQSTSNTAAPGPSSASRITLPGVSNAGQVSDALYRGAQPGPAGYASLAKAGIELVIDLRSGAREEESRAVQAQKMTYVSIPLHCYSREKDSKVAEFLRVLRENKGKKIFVHCRRGEDRTGLMIAAYRMAEEGWSAADAMREMQAWGFSTFHHVECPGLADYEEKFPERLRKGEAFAEWRDLTKLPPAPSTLQSH